MQYSISCKQISLTKCYKLFLLKNNVIFFSVKTVIDSMLGKILVMLILEQNIRKDKFKKNYLSHLSFPVYLPPFPKMFVRLNIQITILLRSACQTHAGRKVSSFASEKLSTHCVKSQLLVCLYTSPFYKANNY